MSNWKDKEVFKTIQLAIPIIMGELAQLSLHLIDTAMVGNISYKHLAAASLVMGQANEALPVALIRGLGWSAPESTAASIVRPPNEDLFR